MQKIWIKALFGAVFLSMLCLTPVMAQEQQSEADGQTAYSNDELKSFILANVGIYQVQQHFATQMPNMESDQQKQQLVQAANQQMNQVLDSVGLTADEYNSMGQTIQSDTQLQEKVNSLASELFEQENQQQQQ